MRLTDVQAIESFHSWPEQDRADYHVRAYLNGLSVVEQMKQDESNNPDISHDCNKLKLVPEVGAH